MIIKEKHEVTLSFKSRDELLDAIALIERTVDCEVLSINDYEKRSFANYESVQDLR